LIVAVCQRVIDLNTKLEIVCQLLNVHVPIEARWHSEKILSGVVLTKSLELVDSLMALVYNKQDFGRSVKNNDAPKPCVVFKKGKSVRYLSV
jgi:hypothetical protein